MRLEDCPSQSGVDLLKCLRTLDKACRRSSLQTASRKQHKHKVANLCICQALGNSLAKFSALLVSAAFSVQPCMAAQVQRAEAGICGRHQHRHHDSQRRCGHPRGPISRAHRSPGGGCGGQLPLLGGSCAPGSPRILHSPSLATSLRCACTLDSSESPRLQASGLCACPAWSHSM